MTNQNSASADFSDQAQFFDRRDYSDALLLELYQALLLPRMIEEKMLILLRQGRISKWFSGIGQEAISVGVAKALSDDEYILPLHRNLGIFTARDLPLERLFAQFQGSTDGYTKGRDRSFHFGTKAHKIVGMISHLGPQLAVANGIALADILENQKRVTVVFSGDGGSSQGDFHEALNVAAVWQLPVIFVIENNGYGLSTPSDEQFRCKFFVDKAIGYGMDAVQVDGNNILDMYHAVETLAQDMRQRPRPVLLEALTFRMRGHEEASGTKYIPKHLFETWQKKDPLNTYEQFLLDNNILTELKKSAYRARISKQIETGLEQAFGMPAVVADLQTETQDMYASAHPQADDRHEDKPENRENPQNQTLRMVDAISQGLSQSMEKFDNLILMGQDIAEYGGVFKVTEGFVEKFGKARVRNTPLCESAIVGAALGLSIRGIKSMVEMQFADFVSCGFNQIVNNLAKTHYRWGQNADVVVRLPTGAGSAAGPFHSQSNEAWFFHVPGLKIAYPSNPYDAKGLLCAAFEDPNPVLYFEHKGLYRSVSGVVGPDWYTIPIGKARMARNGTDALIISYGAGVHWALELAEQLKDTHSIAVLDLRSLLPWDSEAVEAAVRQTGRILVLHEDTLTGGIGAEIAAWIGQHCFQYLDAPVFREASLDTAVPFSPVLEAQFLAKSRLAKTLNKLLSY